MIINKRVLGSRLSAAYTHLPNYEDPESIDTGS
jgi:hypothetical protein